MIVSFSFLSNFPFLWNEYLIFFLSLVFSVHITNPARIFHELSKSSSILLILYSRRNLIKILSMCSQWICLLCFIHSYCPTITFVTLGTFFFPCQIPSCFSHVFCFDHLLVLLELITQQFHKKGIMKNNIFQTMACLKMTLFQYHSIESLVGYRILCHSSFSPRI